MAIFLSVLRRLAYSLTLPLIIFFVTRATGPLEMILIYAAVGVLCGEMISRRTDHWKGIFQVVALVWVSVGVLAIFAILNITPPPAYRIWFRLVREGNAVGLISFYFVMKSVILFSVFSFVTYFGKHLPPLGVGVFIHLLVVGLVLENFIVMGVSVLLLLGILALVDLHGNNTKRKGLGIGILSGVIVLTLLVSAPGILAPPTSPDGIGGETILTLRHFLGRFLPQEYYKLGDGSYYFSFTGATLESPAALSKTPLFDFYGDPGEVHYLRTQTFDRFENSKWDATLLSMRGPVMRMTRAANLDTKYKIRVIGDILSYVPYMEDTREIGLPQKMVGEANQQQFQGEIAFRDIPLTEGMEVYLGMGEPGEPGVAMEYVRNYGDKYLQLPEELPPSLYEKAEEIMAAYDNDLERIGAIKTYLVDEFRYSLNPPVFTGEPLYQFVEINKAGYCVHFATTFVMLARLMGIKTRYVSGFRVYIPPLSIRGVIKVHGLFAHAWPEYYLEENGVWVQYEATPPMMPENLNSDEYWMRFAGEVDQQTLEQLGSIVGSESDAELLDQDAESVDWDDAVYWTSLTVFLSLGLVIFVWLLVLITAYFRVPRTQRVLRRFTKACYVLGGPDPIDRGWTNLSRWLLAQGYWTATQKERFTQDLLPKIYQLREWEKTDLRWFQQEARRIPRADQARVAAKNTGAA
jgi:hypothetical protein